MKLPCPTRPPWLNLAMMRLRQFWICLKFVDKAVVSNCLLDAHPRKERHEEEHRDDGNVIGRRRDGPQLMPILDVDRPNGNNQHRENQKCPFVNESSHTGYFFLATAFISDSSTTGAGPEIPPSFRIRQKCTAMKIDATNGIPMQCQM